jgi:PAS domain-containing protein
MIDVSKATGRELPLSQEAERSVTLARSKAEIESLRREVERLRVLASRDRGLLDAILHHSPHGIMVCDATGKLILQNLAAEKIWAGSATVNDVEGWGARTAFFSEAARPSCRRTTSSRGRWPCSRTSPP